MNRVLRHGEPTTWCAGCALRESDLCRALREADGVGRNPVRLRSIERDRVIVEEGEAPAFLGVIRGGIVRRVKLRRNGDRLLFGLAGPGDIVGAVQDYRASCGLEAATDVELCAFDPGAVSRLRARSIDFELAILRQVSAQHERLLEMTLCRGALTSRERIMAFLVKATTIMPVAPQPDGSLVVTIELARRDWADLTNTAVETISRTMGYLAEKNLVTRLSPVRYRIRDLARLALLAGIDPPLNFGGEHGKSAPSVFGRSVGGAAGASPMGKHTHGLGLSGPGRPAPQAGNRRNVH